MLKNYSQLPWLAVSQRHYTNSVHSFCGTLFEVNIINWHLLIRLLLVVFLFYDCCFSMFNLSLPSSRAPVHVVTGSAGCQEDTDKFQRKCSLYTASMLSQGSVVGVEGRAVSNRWGLLYQESPRSGPPSGPATTATPDWRPTAPPYTYSRWGTRPSTVVRYTNICVRRILITGGRGPEGPGHRLLHHREGPTRALWCVTYWKRIEKVTRPVMSPVVLYLYWISTISKERDISISI